MWKAEVIADSSGKWATNGLVFSTKKIATEYAADLARRWTLVTKFRARRATVSEVKLGMLADNWKERQHG